MLTRLKRFEEKLDKVGIDGFLLHDWFLGDVSDGFYF